MRSLLCLALLVASSAFAGAADSPFPTPPPIPTPMPQPAPIGTTLNVATGSLYVVNAKADGALRVHPAGLVTVAKKKGPITIHGVFVGGSGKAETKEFAGPCVYLIEAIDGKTGRVDIDFIPYGFKADAEIVSTTVDVNAGQAPQPPPPVPVPPVPVPPAPVGFTWAVVVEESAARTPATADVISDLAMWTRIAAKGVKWRVYDVDSADARAKNYDQIAKPIGLPALLLLDDKGKVVQSMKLPAKAQLETIVTGGK